MRRDREDELYLAYIGGEADAAAHAERIGRADASLNDLVGACEDACPSS